MFAHLLTEEFDGCLQDMFHQFWKLFPWKELLDHWRPGTCFQEHPLPEAGGIAALISSAQVEEIGPFCLFFPALR